MAKQYVPFELIRDKARQILLRDSGRLSTSNYTPYPGKTIAPMSSMTQRARGLAERRLDKGMPYQKDLSTLTNAPIEGINEDNINQLQEFAYNTGNRGLETTSNRLQNQFGNSFNRYRDRFSEEADRTNRLKTDELKSDIDLLNPELKKIQGKYRNSAFEAISNSGKSKYDREKSLIDELNRYGEQKHGIINRGLTSEKARFEAERDEPYQRLDALHRIVNGLGIADTGSTDPTVVDLQGKQLIKALQAYGIDTGKPVDQWLTAPRTNLPVYQGKLSEPVNDELAKSYELAENISPFYKDKNYLDRKLTRKSIIDNINPANSVIESLPENLRPKFASLDDEAKKKMEADLTSLNAKYIKQGMYGSNSHLKSVNNRMQDLMSATQDSRGKLIKEGLFKDVLNKEIDNVNNIQKLGQYDQLANTEFGGMLDDVKRSNLKGLEKWKNENQRNEQLYKDYQAEKTGMNPRLITNARNAGYEGGVNSGIDTLFNHFKNQGIDLSTISDLNNRYSEMEKERFSNLDKIKSLEDYKLQAEELAKKNLGEYETEKNQRIALGIERDELNTKLQNEIAARINLETDLKKRAELENQQRELREKEENANRLRLEQTQRQEEARRREEQRVAEENRQAEIRRQENIRRQAEADRQAEVLRIAEVNRNRELKNQALKQYLESAAKRDNLYNSSNVNNVNAISWALQNPTHGFKWFFDNSLKVPTNTSDNSKLIKRLNKIYPEYLEEVKRANYFQDRYNKY